MSKAVESDPVLYATRSRNAFAGTHPFSGFALAAVILFCALLSIAISGHRSGFSNNIFHLPILERLYNEPQFGNDAFVQSLRHYASGFWMLLDGVASNSALLDVFLPLQILARLLFFTGALMMASPLGLANRRLQCAFLLLVALAAPLRGFAPAGGGGLFINEATHSELANATVLIALALAARSRFDWAVAAAGVTFFINIFMAVWLALPTAVLMVLALRRREITLAALSRQLLWGGILCLPLVTPVLLNVVSNPEFGRPLSFDYRTFLTEYWPYHFLVWEVSARQLLRLLATIAVGLAASCLLPSPAQRLMTVLIAGFTVVWALGTIAPLATASPMILNLHLLRSGAIIVILTVLATAALTVHLFHADRPSDRWFWAPVLIVLTAIESVLLPLVIVLIAIRAFWLPPAFAVRRPVVWAALALVGAATLVTITHSIWHDRDFRSHQQQWIALSNWARDHTAPTAMFMLPVTNNNPSSPLPKGTSQGGQLLAGAEVFTTLSHHPIWIGFKEGAAVMWLPSYYREWRGRIIEVLQLDSLPARIEYARRNGIAMIVDACDQAIGPEPVYRSAWLCVFPVAGAVQ